MWTRIRKQSGSTTRLPKTEKNNLILDTTPPNPTACGDPGASQAIASHIWLQAMCTTSKWSFLYQAQVRRVQPSHRPSLKSSLCHSAHAAVPLATPNSIHLFEALNFAFCFANCLWAPCNTGEAMGSKRSERSLSKLKTLLHGRIPKWQKVVLQPTKSISLSHVKGKIIFFVVINLL